MVFGWRKIGQQGRYAFLKNAGALSLLKSVIWTSILLQFFLLMHHMNWIFHCVYWCRYHSIKCLSMFSTTTKQEPSLLSQKETGGILVWATFLLFDVIKCSSNWCLTFYDKLIRFKYSMFAFFWWMLWINIVVSFIWCKKNDVPIDINFLR